MNKKINKYSLILIIVILLSCDRDYANDFRPATLNNIKEITLYCNTRQYIQLKFSDIRYSTLRINDELRYYHYKKPYVFALYSKMNLEKNTFFLGPFEDYFVFYNDTLIFSNAEKMKDIIGVDEIKSILNLVKLYYLT